MLLLLVLAGVATAANDPGHDTLYVLKLGDSNVTGSINLTANLTASVVKFTSKAFGSYLDIMANGSVFGATTVPRLMATSAPDMYLDSVGNLYVNTISGTSAFIQVGPLGGSNAITMNVSGQLLQQNVKVCLQNGTFCPSSLSSANITGSGTTNYVTKWTSTSNLASSLLYDTGTTVGIGNAAPTATLDVNSTVLNTTVLRLITTSNTTGVLNDAPVLELANTNVSTSQGYSNNNYVRIDFVAYNTSGNRFPMASIAGVFANHTNATTGYNGILSFFTNGAGTNAERLRVDQNGNVNVTTGQLYVTGGINATQNGYIAGSPICTPANGLCTGSFLVNNSDATLVTLNVTTKANIASTNLTTLQITENTNLYYTDTRAAAALQNTSIVRNGSSALLIKLNVTTINVSSEFVGTTNLTCSQVSGCVVGAGLPQPSGWINTTNQVFLANNATNVTVGNGSGLSPNLFVDNKNNRVGVGTASPSTIFDVRPAANISGTITLGVNDACTAPLNAKYFDGIVLGDGTETVGIAINRTVCDNGADLVFSGSNSTQSARVERMRITKTGNVGIGTAAPNNRLEVLSTTEPQFRIAYDTAQYTTISHRGYVNITTTVPTTNQFRVYLNGTEQLRINEAGNVGIGTVVPAALLQVNGTGNSRVRASTSGNNGSTPGFEIYDGSNTFAGSMSYYTNSTAATARLQFYTQGDTNNPRMSIMGDGKVGVNTSVPTTKFDVAGGFYNDAITYTGYSDSATLPMKAFMGGFTSGGTMYGYLGLGALYYSAGQYTTYTTTPAILLNNQGTVTLFSDTGKTYNTQYTPTARITVDTTGQVGIGTTGPGAKMDVNGTAYFGGTDGNSINIRGTGETSGLALSSSASGYKEIQSYESEPLYINRQGNNVIFNSGGGSVGIGTTSPGATLDVEASNGIFFNGSTTSGYPDTLFKVLGSTAAGATGNQRNGSDIMLQAGQGNLNDFGVSGRGGNITLAAGNGGVQGISGTGGNGGNILLQPGTAGTGGTAGIVNVTGNLYAGSCVGAGKLCTDIAELFPSRNAQPGDVVCLSPDHNATPCTTAYDKRVIGIISSAPAIVIEGGQVVMGHGNYANNTQPIALKGRVPVKVVCDDPITDGDSLVSSNTTGYAMKLDTDDWQQATGTIVGKALEPCNNGTTTILAWVG